MAARHGRNGRLYVAIASGGSASPIPYINEFTQQASTDRVDITSFGDSNRAYVAGLPDAQGTYSGLWDDATAQLFTAASDGVARKLYWYPDTVNAAGVYWFTTAFLDQSQQSSVTDAAKISGTWSAATSFIKVG